MWMLVLNTGCRFAQILHRWQWQVYWLNAPPKGRNSWCKNTGDSPGLWQLNWIPLLPLWPRFFGIHYKKVYCSDCYNYCFCWFAVIACTGQSRFSWFLTFYVGQTPSPVFPMQLKSIYKTRFPYQSPLSWCAFSWRFRPNTYLPDPPACSRSFGFG